MFNNSSDLSEPVTRTIPDGCIKVSSKFLIDDQEKKKAVGAVTSVQSHEVE
jgi:hypothetical protein